MLLGEGEGAKLTPETVTALLATVRDDVHQAQPAALSITNATEYGRVYTPEETAALGALCRRARPALPCRRRPLRQCRGAASAASPADLTWRAGVDALSFGFTKNGGLSAEALILFDPDARPQPSITGASAPATCSPRAAISPRSCWRCSRATSGCATPAPPIEAAARLAEAAGADRLVYPVEANEVFIRVSADEAAALRAQGFDFYDWGPGEARLVTGWDSDPAHVDALAAAIRAL